MFSDINSGKCHEMGLDIVPTLSFNYDRLSKRLSELSLIPSGGRAQVYTGILTSGNVPKQHQLLRQTTV